MKIFYFLYIFPLFKLNFKILIILEPQVASMTARLSDQTSNQDQLTTLCTDLKTKVRDLETMLSSREDDLKTLQQDNTRLSSHSKNLDVCFSSLKEEKDKIVESLSQMVFILFNIVHLSSFILFDFV